MNTISGIGVALITPFKRDKSIDFNALAKVVENVINGGSDFLVALGTTAETPVLNNEEKKSVVKFISEKNSRKLPLIVGVGGNNTEEAVKGVENLYAEADIVLSVTPYYNKPSQAGLYEHFKTVADASVKPVMLYNVPGRTGVNLSADTCLKLAEHKNIMGIKEASGNLTQMGIILRDRPKNFAVLSGDDALTLPQIAIGADGVISVIGNALPAEFSKMVHLALKGDFESAKHIHLQLIDTIELLFAEGNPVGVKALMNIKGLIENELRLPLVKASDNLYNKLKQLA